MGSFSAFAFLTVGVVSHAGAWGVTPRTRAHHGRRALDVALAIATLVFHIFCVIIVRACMGISIMFVFTQVGLFVW